MSELKGCSKPSKLIGKADDLGNISDLFKKNTNEITEDERKRGKMVMMQCNTKLKEQNNRRISLNSSLWNILWYNMIN